MNRRFNRHIIKIIIKFISIFSGIVGIIWFALYLGQKSIHYSIEFILFTFSIAFLIIIQQKPRSYKIETEEKQKIIKSLEEKIENMVREKERLLEELRQKSPLIKVEKGLDAYSINLDLETSKELIDEDHNYARLVYYAEINRQGDYKARYERYGKRINDGITKFSKIQTGASSPVLYKDLKIRAFNIKNNKRLHDECEDDNLYKKIYKIYLDPAPKNLEDFAIGWTFTWPHCVGGKRDSDTINLKVFRKGCIDKLEHTLVFPFEIHHLLLEEVIEGRDKLVDCEVQPRLEVKGGKFYYSYAIPRPKADGYLFSWFAPEH